MISVSTHSTGAGVGTRHDAPRLQLGSCNRAIEVRFEDRKCRRPSGRPLLSNLERVIVVTTMSHRGTLPQAERREGGKNAAKQRQARGCVMADYLQLCRMARRPQQTQPPGVS